MLDANYGLAFPTMYVAAQSSIECFGSPSDSVHHDLLDMVTSALTALTSHESHLSHPYECDRYMHIICY